MAAIELYHEVHGSPRADRAPLLLVHGGGSTIGTNWSALLPLLSETRQVVAVELQGHGHTPSPADRPFTFENSAADVAAVLDRLGLAAVDVLGFSNGGNVAMRLVVSRPDLVRRLIVASSMYRRDGMIDGFWDGLAAATVEAMPAVYLEADRAINPDPAHQATLFELDSSLMLGFSDWPADDLRAIGVPTLFVCGDRDVIRVDHTAEMAGLVPDARLLVLPATHGDYLGEVLAAGGDLTAMHAALPWLLRFLDA